MKRTFMMVGLAALVGCGAEENRGGAPAISAKPAAADNAVAEVEAEAETVAPRGDVFAALPAGGLPVVSVASKVWPRDQRPALPEAGDSVVGHFDPVEARLAEAARLRAQPLGGGQ